MSDSLAQIQVGRIEPLLRLALPPMPARLNAETVLRSAHALDPHALVEPEPRLSSSHSLALACTARPQSLLLIGWPDMTLAWCVISPGDELSDVLQRSYDEGRARLETIYLAHSDAAGEA